MVKKIVLYDKIYNLEFYKDKNDLIHRYEKYLLELTKGFSGTHIEIKKKREFDNRIEIYIEGSEEKFVRNILKKEIGSTIEFDEIKIGQVLKGTMTELGQVGFGIFVDCAIVKPKKDVLIPLYVLRKQLMNSKKVPVNKIINKYDFIDNFPVFVKITEIDNKEQTIKAEIDQKTLQLFERIINEDIEALFISGATKQQFKKVLIKKDHLRDIISVEKYGFLENIILLKKGSNAVGIISEIGNLLQKCKFSILIPERIKKV